MVGFWARFPPAGLPNSQREVIALCPPVPASYVTLSTVMARRQTLLSTTIA